MESLTQREDFWQDPKEAAKISQELADTKEEVAKIEFLDKEAWDLEELARMSDESLQEEIGNKILALEVRIKEQERVSFLSGKYDKGQAVLSIYSGAGGQDAQDWASMLLRMYQRYCQNKGFKTKVLSHALGEAGGPEGRIGTKSVTLDISGKYAYGLLKKETGVHRLVRISPFSAQQLRHTSFVLVEVLPELNIEDEKSIELKPEDLKIDFYNASGPGGQYVNKRETAVRITHLPTGITVTCQSERYQLANRKKAEKMLLAKLYRMREANEKAELSEIKGGKISASWGNQIRNYILHPYRLVKDARTGVESTDPESILDGNLDQFIEAETML